MELFAAFIEWNEVFYQKPQFIFQIQVDERDLHSRSHWVKMLNHLYISLMILLFETISLKDRLTGLWPSHRKSVETLCKDFKDYCDFQPNHIYYIKIIYIYLKSYPDRPFETLFYEWKMWLEKNKFRAHLDEWKAGSVCRNTVIKICFRSKETKTKKI